jgi:hypothetical protein
VTDSTTASSAESNGQPTRAGLPLGRTLVWLGIAGASATLTYLVLRVTLLRRGQAPGDETTERIQALIDEANHLIKALDEKKQT